MLSFTNDANESYNFYSQISEYRALWNGLSKLTASLGSASCYTVNYIILYGFFTITLSIYELVSEIKQGFNTKHIGILTTCLMGISIIYILCNEAHFVIQNLRIDFQKKLLSIQLPWMSDEVYTEVFKIVFKIRTGCDQVRFHPVRIISKITSQLFITYL